MNTGDRKRARLRDRVRAMWAGRAVCLGLILALAANAGGWAIVHHATEVIIEANAIAVLTIVVMVLNSKLMRPAPSCLFGFICRCLHFNVEHDDLVGHCRAAQLNGTQCGCPAFQHDHNEICTPVEAD